MTVDELGDGPVLFFDGVCNLCTGSVQFVIKHDKQKKFHFASLQSQAGIKIKERLKAVSGSVPDSLILFYNNKIYTRSSAALHTARLLKGGWQIASALLIVPAFIRNFVYDVVAKNRYKWFGRKNDCLVPSPELKSRFLD